MAVTPIPRSVGYQYMNELSTLSHNILPSGKNSKCGYVIDIKIMCAFFHNKYCGG